MNLTKLGWLSFRVLGMSTLLLLDSVVLPAEPAAIPRSNPAEPAKVLTAAPADPITSSGMTESLDVDLKTDPRKALEFKGQVDWRPGQLTVGAGGSIRRGLDLGPQSKMTLRLAFTPLTADGQTSTTCFTFQLRDRGELVAQILRRRQAGKITTEMQLLTRNDAPFTSEKTPGTLRTFVWQRDVPDGLWTFWHNYGLLMVSWEGKRVGAGYADTGPARTPEYLGGAMWINRLGPGGKQGFYDLFGIDEPPEMSGWSLEQQGTPVTCLEVSGKAALSYRKNLAASFEQKEKEKAAPGLGYNYGRPAHASADASTRMRHEAELVDLRARIDHPIWERGRDFPALLENVDSWKYDYHREMVRDCLGEHHPFYALVLQGGGIQHHWGGRDDVARPLLEKAVEISEESLGPWHPDSISATLALGRFYRDLGEFQRAEPLLTKASELTGEVFGTQSSRFVLTLEELTMLFQDTGRFAEAEALLRPALESCKDASPRDHANFLSALGELEASMGERDKAAALFGQAQDALEGLAKEELESYRKDGQPKHQLVFVDRSNTEAQHGRLLLRDGKKDAARELARAAFLPLVQFNDQYTVGAGVFRGWDHRTNWRSCIPNQLLLPHPSYLRVMIALGDLFEDLGDGIPALACVRAADTASLSLHTPHDTAVLYRTTAKLYEEVPNVVSPGRSKRDFLQFTYLERLTAANDDEEQERQALIAFGQGTTGASSLSEEQRKKLAAKLSNPNRQPKVRPPDYALDWHKIAVREFEKTSGAEHPETIDELLSEARWQWSSNGPEDAEAVLCDASNRTAKLSDRVLAGLSETQSYQFLEATRPSADLLLSCYRATNNEHARNAYETIWRSKALATQQLMERRELLQAASGRPELIRLADDLQMTRQRLASFCLFAQVADPAERDRQLAELTDRKEGLERELARLSEPFRRTRDAGRTSVADMVRRLPAKTAVVDFVERRQWTPPGKRTEPWEQTRCYDAFVLGKADGGPGWSAAWLALGDADALDRLLDNWIMGLRRQATVDGDAEGELRRQLWAPIESALAGCETVILIPDGRLAQIPWAALPGRTPDTYLLEDYALVEAPYGQYVARVLTDPPAQGDGFLAVGGVNYGQGGKWSYLKGTAAEVEKLVALRPGAGTVRLSGDEATKQRLQKLLPGRRYIHLATHGEFLDPGPGHDSGAGGVLFDASARNPLLLSMLVLAGANRPVRTDAQGLPIGSDSFLTAEEVMSMDLSRTELVVMSACETGAGKVRNGEGVFSLQRAFLVGGSRAVVATLWSISDGLPTQALMERFYGNLWKRRMGKLEALREAQLWLLREGAKQPELIRGRGLEFAPGAEQMSIASGRLSPRYWASFELSGDWR